MSDLYKTIEAIEFKEIFESLEKDALEKGQKFSQRKLAKILHISDSAVSQILKKGKNPSKQSLEGIRALKPHGDLHIKNILIEDESVEKLSQQLDYLREKAPAKYETAKQVILSLAESVVECVSSAKADPSVVEAVDHVHPPVAKLSPRLHKK